MNIEFKPKKIDIVESMNILLLSKLMISPTSPPKNNNTPNINGKYNGNVEKEIIPFAAYLNKDQNDHLEHPAVLSILS